MASYQGVECGRGVLTAQEADLGSVMGMAAKGDCSAGGGSRLPSQLAASREKADPSHRSLTAGADSG